MSAVTGNKVTKANATISDLGTFFGLGSATTLNDVCRASTINRWAKYKPVAYERLSGGNAHPSPLSVAELQSVSYGLTKPSGSMNPFTAASQSWSYSAPSSTDWCRISDFLNASDPSANAYGYDHSAIAPVQRNTFAPELTFNIVTNNSISWSIQAVTSSATAITLSDLTTISNYYLAFCWMVGSTMYLKTASSSITSTSGNIITLTKNDTFGTIPNGSATFDYCICLCNGSYTSAGIIANTGNKFYYPLPVSSTAQATGTLTVVNATLSLSPGTLPTFSPKDIGSDSGKTVRINSNTTWTMTVTGGIFNTNRGTSYSGSGNMDILIFPTTQNKSTDNRTGVLTVVDSQNQTVTLNLVQEKCIPITALSIYGMDTLSLNDAPYEYYSPVFTPSNATYTDVTWSLVSGSDICTAGLEDVGGEEVYKVALKNNAQNGDTIKIRVVSDEYPNVTPGEKTIAVVAQTAIVPVESVSLNTNTLSIYADETAQLTATVLPSDATDKSVTWASDDTTIATVDQNGLVTGVSSGECGITVTTTDGNYTARCAVSASPARYTFTINATPVGATVTMTANGTTATGNSQQFSANTIVNWTVSAPGYASQSGQQTIIADYTKNVTLSIIELQSISIDGVSELGLDTMTDGFVVVYNPENTGQKGVTWSIIQGSDKCSGQQIDVNDVGDGYQITLNNNAADGDTIILQATSTIVSGKTAIHTITVVDTSVVDTEVIISAGNGVGSMGSYYYISNSNNQGTFVATVQSLSDPQISQAVTWSLSSTTFATIDSTTGVLTVKNNASVYGSDVYVIATSVAEPTISATVRVILYYK